MFSKQTLCDWKLALHCAVKMADNLSGNNLTNVFLATDSTLVKEMALREYGNRVRTLNNHILHVDKMFKVPHPLSAEEKEGKMVVWIEFLFLAQGKISMWGKSGFPWTAGLLCRLRTGSKNVTHTDSCS